MDFENFGKILENLSTQWVVEDGCKSYADVRVIKIYKNRHGMLFVRHCVVFLMTDSFVYKFTKFQEKSDLRDIMLDSSEKEMTSFAFRDTAISKVG